MREGVKKKKKKGRIREGNIREEWGGRDTDKNQSPASLSRSNKKSLGRGGKC